MLGIVRIKLVLFLAALLLPSLAWAQKNDDCLIFGQTARISGKVEYRYDDTRYLQPIHNYVVKLLQPRCFTHEVFFQGKVLDEKFSERVMYVEIYVYENGPPEELVGPFTESIPDGAARRKKAEDWLKTMTGKLVVVAGDIDDLSNSGYSFANAGMSIHSIAACQLAPKSRNIEKC